MFVPQAMRKRLFVVELELCRKPKQLRAHLLPILTDSDTWRPYMARVVKVITTFCGRYSLNTSESKRKGRLAAFVAHTNQSSH